MICSNCGKEISYENNFCTFCGNAMKPIQKTAPNNCDNPQTNSVGNDSVGCIILSTAVVFKYIILFAIFVFVILFECYGLNAIMDFITNLYNNIIKLCNVLELFGF